MNLEQFQSDTRKAIEDSRGLLDSFLALPKGADFADTLAAFDRILLPLARVSGRVNLYSSVHPEADVRQASEALERELVAFHTDLSLNRDVYERLVAFEEKPAPDATTGRLLEHSLRDYRRSGVDKDEDTRARIRELNEELVEIGQEFDRNILEDTRRIKISEGQAGLAGLPADYIAAHPEAEDGSVTITTDPPDLMPFLDYAERDDLRRELLVAFLNRAYPKNESVLLCLLEGRFEQAELLGYEDYATYVTEDKMIRTPEAAREFIERTWELAQPRMKAERDELLEELRREDPEAESVRDWQRAYLSERLKTRRFDFDSQTVRPYFAYARVRDGLLALCSKLFDVEFRPQTDADLWHPDVEAYEIVDKGDVIARFYLDMHPREGKFKHAAMFHVTDGVAGEILPEASLVCNFPQPKNGDSALMQHAQVKTFFHEFGHLLHHLFGGHQPYLKFSGIATEADFIEAPSQLFEEWCWDPEVLATFAHHHETEEPIPADLVERMRRASEHGKGIQVATQMFYADLSLTLYDCDPEEIDPMALHEELKQKLSPFPYTPDTHMPAAFGHLNGYSAAYYTYMWSLVIAKDLFSPFEGAILNPETARRYRESVLAPGGSKDAADLVQDFLGREYAFEAWERWLNR